MYKNSTICAVSTPSGAGGIAVIRVSGQNAFNVCDKIFVAKNGKKLSEAKANTVVFGQIIMHKCSNNEVSCNCGFDPQFSNCEIIDEVLVSVFRAPHSFTGENVIEISAHGSVFIQQKILQLLLDAGCTLAAPGEFTQRAFMNGKMDLSQAEAVADLIASQNAAAHKIAMNQMRGGFSAELQKLRSQLLDFVSLIELELDFSEENVEFADREILFALAKSIEAKVSRLVYSFNLGNAIKNGIPVVIAGETNVGKSSLLNFLLNEEKAIISDIHGTTRDVIEDTVNIHGVAFRFIDTAGIRSTENEIEKIGIERAYQQIQKAQIMLCLLDCTKNVNDLEKFTDKIFDIAKNTKNILIFNKIDLIDKTKIQIIHDLYQNFDCPKFFVSVKEKINMEHLLDEILKASNVSQINENDVIITNIRHFEIFKNVQIAIERVVVGLNSNLSGDLLSQDIRETMHYLGEITGEITANEILGNIFSKFCIGK
ncbi:MAG: tRNA uridine-5-carboxymethylaminomethyl(34) synthesis GTPase MnmE [Prevotellaceae bacterium]|jgi:tRNA modification GTPase|nr:tRNA uridine-5-carboxymethylaminomethyl(34) synthesis GTPase MnmE [Prevotellaceae bacterium]